MRAPVGELNLADQDYGIGRGLAAITAKAVEKRFLGYLLIHCVPALSSVATGSTYDAVSAGQIGNLRIPVPNLETQTTIANFLDRETYRIHTLVQKKRNLHQLLLQKKKAQISAFVKRGLNPGVPMKATADAWRGDVPVHWQVKRIKNLFRQSKRQNHPELTVLSVYRDLGVIVKDSRDDNINKTPEDLTAYQLVEPGDLVVNKMKAWQGSLGISQHLGITSPDYVVFVPINPHNSRFVHHYLRAQPLPSVYMTISNGIRPDQWRLEPQKFRDIPVWLPDTEEQEAIATHIDAFSDKIDKIAGKTACSIEKLEELRTALICSAVTGRIDPEAWYKRGATERKLDAIDAESII